MRGECVCVCVCRLVYWSPTDCHSERCSHNWLETRKCPRSINSNSNSGFPLLFRCFALHPPLHLQSTYTKNEHRKKPVWFAWWELRPPRSVCSLLAFRLLKERAIHALRFEFTNIFFHLRKISQIQKN